MTLRTDQQDSVANIGYCWRSLDGVAGEGGAAGWAKGLFAALKGEVENAALRGIEAPATSAR
jgi:hypothetical protein